MTPPVLQEIPLEQLHESPLNPRRIFDPAKLEELKLSILEVGVLTPLTVRPAHVGGRLNPVDGKPHYEIGAGHRRYRAAKLAGLASVPAFVRVMDDKTFLELLIFENPDHDHLHPLEEAQGYRTLMERAGYDIARLAERAGKSVKYIYDRIKLLQLTKPAQKLFLEGKFTAGHAILLARLSPQDQARAIDLDGVEQWRVGGLFRDEHVRDDDQLELKDEAGPVTAVSVREFEQWIEEHVRLVPEKTDLPMLFPEADVALRVAAQIEEKVVKITYDYQVPQDARPDEGPEAKEKVYGPKAWKRADGEPWDDPHNYSGRTVKSKTCEHSVTGVIVIGEGRGQAFKVCVAKKKCRIHWPEQKQPKASGSKKEEDWEARQRRQDARDEKERQERAHRDARWKKATPAILDAIVARIKKLPASARGVLGDLIVGSFRVSANAQFAIGRGTSAEDLVRYVALLVVREELGEWDAQVRIPKVAGRLGVNVKKILDEAAPEKLHKCERCGCDEEHACPGGCSWDPKQLKKGHHVCSTCVKVKQPAKKAKAR